MVIHAERCGAFFCFLLPPLLPIRRNSRTVIGVRTFLCAHVARGVIVPCCQPDTGAVYVGVSPFRVEGYWVIVQRVRGGGRKNGQTVMSRKDDEVLLVRWL